MNVNLSGWNVNRMAHAINNRKTMLDILFGDRNVSKNKKKDSFSRSDVYDISVYTKKAEWKNDVFPEKTGAMIPDAVLTAMNNNIANLHKSGDIFECGGMYFTADQIPKINGSVLHEVKASNNVMDFGRENYFKYISADGKEHCLYADHKTIGSIVSESMRGAPYDETLEKYAGFWRYMMSKDPIVAGLSYSDEEIRNYMDEAGVQVGFFTVKAGDREATQFYSATKTTCPVQSKLRYDQQYQRLTEKSPFFDSFEVGSVFKIGGKDYILNESHMLDIPYGEDIFDIQYPDRGRSQ